MTIKVIYDFFRLRLSRRYAVKFHPTKTKFYIFLCCFDDGQIIKTSLYLYDKSI